MSQFQSSDTATSFKEFSFNVRLDEYSGFPLEKRVDSEKTSQGSCDKTIADSFHLQQGLNPITTLATPLLLLLQRLRTASNCNAPNLQAELIAELRRFEADARARSYGEKDIFIARYLLASTLDDAIAQSSFHDHSQWEHYSLLSSYLHEPAYSDRFVMIVQRALQEADQYLDLLELAYLCIRLGYKANQNTADPAHERLHLLASELFYTIGHRKEVRTSARTLASGASINSLQQGSRVKSLPTFFGLTSLIVLLLYLGFSYVAQLSSQSVYDDFRKVQKVLQQSHTDL